MQTQSIASQILNETPSENPASVNANLESSEPTEQSQKPSNEFDERFGVLAKMERKLKEREQMFKQREQEWEQKGSKLSEYEEFMKLFDENPLEALKKKKGWGVQEFNKFAVEHSEDEDLDPVAKLTKDFQSQLDELRSKLTQEFEGKIKAKEDEINSKEQERQVSEFKGGIRSFLAENKDTFEFIHAEGEEGAGYVFDLIYQDVMKQRESGTPENELKVMDIKTAAERVETFLDKQHSKYLGLNKVKSKFGAQDGNPALSAFNKKQSDPTTLNSSFSPKSKSLSESTEEERKQNAIAMVRSWKN